MRGRTPDRLHSAQKDESAFAASTQLFVEPDGCIDCGACVPVCTSDAIHPMDEPTEDQKFFAANNTAFFAN